MQRNTQSARLTFGTLECTLRLTCQEAISACPGGTLRNRVRHASGSRPNPNHAFLAFSRARFSRYWHSSGQEAAEPGTLECMLQVNTASVRPTLGTLECALQRTSSREVTQRSRHTQAAHHETRSGAPAGLGPIQDAPSKHPLGHGETGTPHGRGKPSKALSSA